MILFLKFLFSNVLFNSFIYLICLISEYFYQIAEEPSSYLPFSVHFFYPKQYNQSLHCNDFKHGLINEHNVDLII